MKTARQAKIIEIIREYDIVTQQELCRRLNEAGFKVTQATVSRDIRDMGLTKLPLPDGTQKYAFAADTRGSFDGKYTRVFKEGVVSRDTAQNILVIKTVSGMAMAVAAALDAMDYEEIVGSIAGDDTIMCAVRTGEEADSLKERLREI